jgi:hypothetical protein
MKIWYQYGSEHSANLVMIGHFEDATKAIIAKEIIDALTLQVEKDEADGTLIIGHHADRYGDKMLDLLGRLNVSIGPNELEQFSYDVKIEVKGSDIILKTDELDISAFLKVLFLKGARIEVYSAHDYPNTGHGQ